MMRMIALICLAILYFAAHRLAGQASSSGTTASNTSQSTNNSSTNFRILQRYEVLITPKKMVTSVQAPREVTVYFPQESIWIDDVQRKQLESLLFKQGSTVTIEGHADATGIEWVNQRLALQRAEAVRTVLSKKNKDAQLTVRSWGSSRPLGDNRTESGRRANRRVVITFYGLE